MAALEALVCLAQAMGILNSQNSFFIVTGTWDNPNVTAMFMAMSMPSALALRHQQRPGKKLIASFFILVCLALILLKCRTAWIGLSVTIFLFAEHHYHLFQRIKQFSMARTVLLTFTACVLMIFISYGMYQAKKSSANGRVLIWKVCAQMISSKPITGYGYGSFDREYNLAQARYLEHEPVSEDALTNAGYVKMAYNELLQSMVEGGLLGGVLLAAFFISLVTIRTGGDDKITAIQVSAKSGIIAFIAMSMVNFTIQAIPAMCVFLAYAAILSSSIIRSRTLILQTRVERLTTGSAAFALGLLLLVLVFPLVKANYLNKRAAEEAKKGNLTAAKSMLAPLRITLSNYESYWRNYGSVLFKNKDYQGAAAKFAKAKLLTSDPEMYLTTGYCEEQSGRYQKAFENYEQYRLLEPGKIMPLVAQMRIYWKTKDTVNTALKAAAILDMPVKISNESAYLYKRQALTVLNKIQKNKVGTNLQFDFNPVVNKPY